MRCMGLKDERARAVLIPAELIICIKIPMWMIRELAEAVAPQTGYQGAIEGTAANPMPT